MVVDLSGYNGLINTHGYTGENARGANAGLENTGHSSVAIRAQECDSALIKCSEEKRFVKTLIMVYRT